MSDFDLDKMSEEDILRFDIDAHDTTDESAAEVVDEVVEEVTEEEEAWDEEAEESSTEEPEEESEEESEEVTEETTKPNKTKEDFSPVEVDFKGSKIKIENRDELIKLVQKGLGSNKRMQEIKPKLKMMAMLEEHGLASEQALNLIIDAIAKKDKSAFGKLLKDSNIDALDIEDSQYVDKDYSISESQFDLQVLLDENKDSPVYVDTITSIKAYDVASKEMIGKQPERFLTILADKESGVYSQIESIVKSEQLKGNLSGLGFLAAYEQVVGTIRDNLALKAGHNGKSQQPNTGASHNKKDSTQGTRQAKAVSSSSIGGGFGGKGKVYDLSKLSADELAKMPNTAFD